jgi:hypothetical protein
MTYTQAQNLLEAMDNLERYAQLWQHEMGKDDSDFGAMTRYKLQIQDQRKRIFHALDKS